MTIEDPTLEKLIEEITWPTPRPLLHDVGHEASYPIQVLPPIIQDAVTAYQQYGQQPLPLIACSALANISLVQVC